MVLKHNSFASSIELKTIAIAIGLVKSLKPWAIEVVPSSNHLPVFARHDVIW